ncbi:MAG: DUF3106 domain-containing protein [Verrucomicrobiota bacterium]
MKVWRLTNDFPGALLCLVLVAPSLGTLLSHSQDLPKTQSGNAPPALPVVKPPIERFRELLLLPEAERDRALAEKPPEQRKTLAAKLKEYESMTAEERELRLAVTELRWYLTPLMRTAPAERGPGLNLIPAERRPLVEDRLRQWDTLAASQQKEFLESEMTINYFLRLQSGRPDQQTNLLENLSPAYRQQLDAELSRWRSLPDEQRDRMFGRFQQFFDLNAQEKERTLGTLSESERAQMEDTLQTFQKLPAEQRRHCIRSFSKFASLSAGDRQQFLQKAELWKSMSPSDRQTWRGLVQKLPQIPPLPPGFKFMPPLPPDPRFSPVAPPELSR